MTRPYRKPFLSTAEVAELFGVKELTVREWCREGILVATRPRKSWRISRKSVEEVLQKKFGDNDE